MGNGSGETWIDRRALSLHNDRRSTNAGAPPVPWPHRPEFLCISVRP
jgi:hypothetical protein